MRWIWWKRIKGRKILKKLDKEKIELEMSEKMERILLEKKKMMVIR